MLLKSPTKIWYWCRKHAEMDWWKSNGTDYVATCGATLNPLNLAIVYSTDEHSYPPRVLVPLHVLTGAYPPPPPEGEEPLWLVEEEEVWEHADPDFDG